jgi:5'-nucleotidase
MAIILVDLLDVMCHYTRAITKFVIANPTNSMYPQSQFDFYRKLKPIRGAVQAFRTLAALEEHSVWIVSAPSIHNPMSYTEKRMWVEEHLGMEHVHRLIICSDKSMIKGDVLIDDHTSGRGQENFKGTLIKFDPENHAMWAQVLEMIPRKPNSPYTHISVKRAGPYTARILTDRSWAEHHFFCYSPLFDCRADRNYYLVTASSRPNPSIHDNFILEVPCSWIAAAIESRLRTDWDNIRADRKEGWRLIPIDYNRRVVVNPDIELAEDASTLIVVFDKSKRINLLRLRPVLKKGSKRQKLREAFPRLTTGG